MRRPSKRKLPDHSPTDSDAVKMRKPDPITPSSSGGGDGEGVSDELHFFVRTPTGTLVIHALPTATISSILSQISAITGIPSSEQRLVYRGRQLCDQHTLAACSVETDASIQLTGRLRSTPFPRAWQIAGDLISSAIYLASHTAANLRSFHEEKLIISLIMQFITETPQDEDKTWGHLQVFLLSDCPAALVKLYLSSVRTSATLAERCIRLFLVSNEDYFPKVIYSHCTPIVLAFCKILAGTAGRGDLLYVECRRAFADLLDEQGGKGVGRARRVLSRSKAAVHIQDLLPFVIELGGVVIEGLHTEIMLNSAAQLRQFSIFVIAVRRAIWDWMDEAGHIPKMLYTTAHPQYKEWVGSLHTLFVELLEKVNKCLATVDDCVVRGAVNGETHSGFWGHLLVVMTDLNRLSKIFDGGKALLHEVLFSWRIAVNFLIHRAMRSEVSFRWLLKHKDVTDFESRQKLVQMLLPEGKDDYTEMHEMLIDRAHLLAESFTYIGQAQATSLHGGIFMEFKNEEATGPGVLREWFCLLCQAIFNPQNVLFVACPKDRRRVFPNPTSVVDPLHLKYFVFCGRIIALSLMHKVQVGIVFDRVFFLQLAGRNVSLEDVQDADPDLYMSCKKILEMEVELLDSDALALTFVREFEELGTRRAVELCPGGKDIIVDSKNREEYVNLLIEHRFVTSISEQIEHFAQGFGDILNNSKFQKFFFQSLELQDFDRMLGGGDSIIDVKEWKAHTEYNGYKARDRQIGWFWKVVESMQPEERRVLLFFWTSVKYLPADGFRGLASKLYIYKNLDSHDRLPTSHTCFHRLCLPPYPNLATMRARLHLITQEHVSCSFGRY